MPMRFEEKYAILQDALREAGKYMREYPPAEMPNGEYSDIIIKALVGGAIDDPEGNRYVSYFLERAIKNRNSQEEAILIDRRALDFIRQMVNVYGVISCFDNVDEETNTLEDEGLWFECPICGEPILIYDDWELEDIMEICPVCEERYDEED